MGSEIEQYGYDAHFVDVVQEYLKCSICHLVMRNPVQAMQCGHRFCTQCFDRLQGYSKHLDSRLSCPIDRKVIDIKQVFEDTGVSKVISGLKVSCSRQCSWIGQLFDLQQHESKCLHEPDSCLITSENENRELLLKKVLQRIQKCEFSLIEKDNLINNLKCDLDKMKLTMNENKEEIDTLKRHNSDIQMELNSVKKKYDNLNYDIKNKIDTALKTVECLESILIGNAPLTDEQINSGLIEYLADRIEGKISDELALLFHEELDKKYDNSCKLLHSEILKLQNEHKKAVDEINEFQNKIKHCFNNKDNEFKVIRTNFEEINDNFVALSTQVENLEKISFCYDSWLSSRSDIQFKWVLSEFDYYFERGTEVHSPTLITQLQGYTLNIFIKWSGVNKEHFGLFVNVDRRLVVKDVVHGTFRFDLLNKLGRKKGQEFSIANQKKFMMPPDQQIAKMTFGFAKFLTMEELKDYIINDKLFILCSYYH